VADPLRWAPGSTCRVLPGGGWTRTVRVRPGAGRGGGRRRRRRGWPRPIRWGSSAPGCGRGARTGQGRPAAGTAGPWVRRRPGRRPGRAGAARPGRLFFTTRTSSQHGLRPPQLVATAPRPWAGGCVRRGAGQAQQRPDQRRRPRWSTCETRGVARVAFAGTGRAHTSAPRAATRSSPTFVTSLYCRVAGDALGPEIPMLKRTS